MYGNYMIQNGQYGVDPIPQLSAIGTPTSLGSSLYGGSSFAKPDVAGVAYRAGQLGNDVDSFSNLAGKFGILGSIMGFGAQMIDKAVNFDMQERLLSEERAYNSPAALMRRMAAAGINPNAAAQGIAGSPGYASFGAPQVNGGTNPMSSLADILANSVNTSLNANVLRNTASNIEADTNYKNSLNVEQTVKNQYADAMHNETLKNMIYRNQIDKSSAQIIAADAKYAEANAFANWQTTCMNLSKIASEVKLLDQKYYTEMAQTYATLMAGNLSSAQIHKVFSDIGVNNATIREIEKRTANIEADTLLKGRTMKESEARTTAQEIQNKFQQEYYSLFENTGWDMNSDVDMNVYRMMMNGETENYKRFMHGMNVYIGEQGNANARGNRYKMDNLIDIYKTIVSAAIPLASPPSGGNNYYISPSGKR